MRAEGFYWCNYDGNWIIGEYIMESWYFCDPMLDYPGGHYDEDLVEIDERRIERGHNDIIELLKNNTKTHLPDYLSDNPYLCNYES